MFLSLYNEIISARHLLFYFIELCMIHFAIIEQNETNYIVHLLFPYGTKGTFGTTYCKLFFLLNIRNNMILSLIRSRKECEFARTSTV